MHFILLKEETAIRECGGTVYGRQQFYIGSTCQNSLYKHISPNEYVESIGWGQV